jgi:hypothetical protein
MRSGFLSDAEVFVHTHSDARASAGSRLPTQAIQNAFPPLHSTPPLPMSFSLSQSLEPESAQKVLIPRLAKQHVAQKDRVDKSRYETSGIQSSFHPRPPYRFIPVLPCNTFLSIVLAICFCRVSASKLVNQEPC